MTDELKEMLRVEAEGALVMDVAKHISDQVHEIVKRHAAAMPTVTAAISLGLVTVKQIYWETISFAMRSMEGDAEDAAEIRKRAEELMRDLLEIADREIDDARARGELP